MTEPKKSKDTETAENRQSLTAADTVIRFLDRLSAKIRNFFESFSARRRKKEEGLTHKEALEMLSRYLSDDLSDEETTAFLSHIGSCRDCYEELETMYLVDRTIHYLDDSEDGSFDLKTELLHDMEKKMRRIRRNLFFGNLRRISTAISAGFFVLAVMDFFGLVPISRLI
ncbi:MAG: anti-sigma factor family protein [Bilifractor sp.]